MVKSLIFGQYLLQKGGIDYGKRDQPPRRGRAAG